MTSKMHEMKSAPRDGTPVILLSMAASGNEVPSITVARFGLTDDSEAIAGWFDATYETMIAAESDENDLWRWSSVPHSVAVVCEQARLVAGYLQTYGTAA